MAAATAAAVVSWIGFTGTAATIATYALTVAFTLAASFATSALMSKKGFGASYSQKDNMVTVRQPAVSWEYMYGRVRKGGSYAFIHSTDNHNYLHLVIIVADREISSIDEIYFGDQLVTLDVDGNATGTNPSGDNYQGYVRVIKRLGTANQTAFAELIADAPDKWTSAHRLRGKACVYVRLKYEASRFAGGIPNITIIGDGHKLYDPRDALQVANDPSTWTFDDNADLCLADYLRDKKIGLSALESEIPLAEWIAAANACDEAVPLSAGGTEKRYTCNGIVDSANTHKTIVEGLLTAMNGKVVTTGTSWKIYPAVWRVPEKSLDEGDLRSGINTKTRRPRKDLINGVRGLYTSPANDYQPADFPAVISDAFVALDGEENFLDLSLPYTNSASMAQRIAKIQLLQSRQQITTNWPCKLTAWSIEAPDVVALNRTTLGWSNKNFEVMRAPTVVENGLLGCDLVMSETDPSIYDWSTNEETTVDPAPDTTLPNPSYQEDPAAITAASGSELLKVDSAGQLVSQIKVTVSPPLGAFVKEYQIEWKIVTESIWNEMIVPGSPDRPTQVSISPVVDAKTYNIRVRARSRYGALSNYIDATPHLVEGKATAPGDVDQFTISVQPDGTREFNVVHLQPDADVRVGGGYHILYASGPTIDLTTADSLNTGKITSWPWETNMLPAGEYTFACRVMDSSNNTSQNPKIITATLPDPRMRNAVAAWDERSLGWAGVKTDCFVNYENELEASGAQSWDDLGATWDVLGNGWSGIITSKSPIKYETEVYDLGTDISVTPLVAVGAVGTVTIKMRTAIDVAGGDLSALAYVATAQVACRYIQFEITVSGTTPVIKTLTPVLDGETLIDDQGDINTALTSSGTFEKIATGHFKIGVSRSIASITFANIAAKQNVGSGWSDELISKSATLLDGTPAAEFKLYNSAGALADAIIDVTLKGPKA